MISKNKCECCEYVYTKSLDKQIYKDVVDFLNSGFSEIFIEAKLYGKYKSKFSIKEINNFILNVKNSLL